MISAVQQGRGPPSSSLVGYGFPGSDYSSFPSTAVTSVSSSSYLTTYISQLVRAEPHPASRYSSMQTHNMIGIDTICEFAAKLLFSAVEWSRSIPGRGNCLQIVLSTKSLRFYSCFRFPGAGSDRSSSIVETGVVRVVCSQRCPV